MSLLLAALLLASAVAAGPLAGAIPPAAAAPAVRPAAKAPAAEAIPSEAEALAPEAEAVPPAAKAPAAGTRVPKAKKTGSTTVTSDRLDVNYEKNQANFDGNVLVKDRSGELRADRMIVRFDPKTRAVSELDATGKQVVISTKGRKAVSRRAVYTAPDGKIVLTGDPRIYQDRNEYAADRITIYKDQDKTIFEPRARLVLFSDGGEGFSGILPQ